MGIRKYCLITCIVFLLYGCDTMERESEVQQRDTVSAAEQTGEVIAAADTTAIEPSSKAPVSLLSVNTKNVTPDQLISFAKTLVGTPYKYASTDPAQGFDCSGFITYVFNHFNLVVPRSSIDFTNVGREVNEQEAKPGDIILFTGTNPAERFVGHMGLVVQGQPELQFIHSSSGKANGVTITPMNDYYRTRFVKITRVFPRND